MFVQFKELNGLSLIHKAKFASDLLPSLEIPIEWLYEYEIYNGVLTPYVNYDGKIHTYLNMYQWQEFSIFWDLDKSPDYDNLYSISIQGFINYERMDCIVLSFIAPIQRSLFLNSNWKFYNISLHSVFVK